MKELLLKLSNSWSNKAKEAKDKVEWTAATSISNSYALVANNNFTIDQMIDGLKESISKNPGLTCLYYEQGLVEANEMKRKLLVEA